MLGTRSTYPPLCNACLRRQSKVVRRSRQHGSHQRTFVSILPPRDQQPSRHKSNEDERDEEKEQTEITGAMSRRLAHMTTETLESGGRTAQKAIEEAGFSEELKRQLEAKIQGREFRNKNPAAFAQMDMPSSAGKGTQQIASAQPWTGTESTEDAALRMLTDAYKPMRGPSKIPQPRAPAVSVDMRMKKAIQKSQGQRLANARDQTSVYALSQDATLTEKEREAMRQQLKERFTAGARPIPATVQGLTALANERIEDAIARGQFQNIARGKGQNVERDHNASSPFLDTTEYFMNKIIQKQEIVPPWIEKQQELVKAAGVFRSRIRADWKRHAARVIASKGGSLEDQVRRAEAYAVAEAAINPKKVKREALSEIDEEGRLSQLTVTETSESSASATNGDIKITVSEDLASKAPAMDPSASPSTPSEAPQADPPNPPNPPPLSLPPFRDAAYLSLEAPYHTLSITSLNSLTRSYNLQAPALAKKPYFGLDRELRSCFADVAPQLADAIRERARKPQVKVEVVGHRPGGVLERFGAEQRVKVYDDRRERYGWREFWRDLRGG